MAEDYKDVKACLSLKKKHDECYYGWMAESFLPGKARRDDCLPQWQAYEQCITKKLAALNLSHLKRSGGTGPGVDVFALDLHPDKDTLPPQPPSASTK